MATEDQSNKPTLNAYRTPKNRIKARPKPSARPRSAAAPAEPAVLPLMSDPRHVTPVAYDEPFVTWHRVGMADIVPVTVTLPRVLADMLRHALAWAPPEGVTRTITLSLDQGYFTVDLNCDGHQPEEGVEFHVGLPSDGECIAEILDEAADEALVAMDRPPARTGPGLATNGSVRPAGEEVL